MCVYLIRLIIKNRTLKKAISMAENMPGSFRMSKNITKNTVKSLAAVLMAMSLFGLVLFTALLTVTHNPAK